MTIRNLNPTLTASLLENDEFVYAHLVKFEKPLKTLTGGSSQRANDYAYITDGSHDIAFDDGSKTTDGNSNGIQTYLAGKLLQVGTINETIEARASSINLLVSATSLNTVSSVIFTTTNSTIITNLDLVKEGFSEGDVIRVSATGGNNDGIKVRIDAFANNNKTIEVTAVIGSLSADSSTRAATLTFDTPEVNGILADKTNASYAGYINRDVQIYKAHINPTTGGIIGAPYLIFKGIIGTANLTEDPAKGSKISWGVTSHWGDFQSVNGRLTSDQQHRALDGNAIPDRSALIRPEYANDLGFLHSEQAINLVAIYQVMETRYKLKKKKKFLGFSKYKQITYEEEVDRETDLRFNLDAKYLPVVYGVQKIDSIPFFVDTDKTDSKQVFVAYALCEGEIGGVYDMYFDDTSSICLDKNDNDTRSTQTDENTIDVLCSGRMDRGDVLASISATTSSPQSLSEAIEQAYRIAAIRGEVRRVEDIIDEVSASFANQPSTTGTSVGTGLIHESGHSIQTPIDGKFIVHTGKRGQRADALLVSKAQSNSFKIQGDYFEGNKQNYWGTNHRVLDTAYVVAQYTIGEGETSIPEVDFVVRGKLINSYNYDRAYGNDNSQTSAAISNFNLGDTVDIKKTSDNSTIISSVTIKDIFTTSGRDGASIQKVQFLEDLGLGLTTAFYMQQSSNKYYLETWDNPSVTGTVGAKLEQSVASVAAGTSKGVKVTISSTSDTAKAWEDFTGVRISLFPTTADQAYINNLNSEDLLFTYSSSNPGIADNIAHDSVANFNAAGINKILVKNVVKLSNDASSSDNAYIGKVIVLTKIESDGSARVQTRRIIDYDGTNKFAKVDMAFDGDMIPDTTFSFSILSEGDDRVSINPAIQLLDYLQDKRYGKGLDLTNDIDLEGFKAAARDCDTPSDVTVQFAGSVSIAVGEKYRFPATGTTFWHGKVKTVETAGTKKQVTFTDCSGKLGNKWFDWKTYTDGDLFWHAGNVYIKSGTGTSSSAPSGTSDTVTLRKVGTSTDIDIDTSEANFDGNPVVKKYSANTASYLSGYSLYDSDFVKYWKYLGWEAQHQRHVTRHQTNTVVDTGSPVFDNINNMLLQFNGLLRYSSGKYTLDIAGAAANLDSVTVGSTTYYPGLITEDDIIGSIQIEDSGLKGTYNTVSVSIPDPSNRFEDRSVTFFNSDYLKEDRNMPKKGDIKTPNITNYFNARINAKQYLERSRYGLSVNFKMAPKGFLLLPGEIIRITYPRFGFNQKLFRISNIGLTADCLVSVSAEEHNDDAFLVQEENRQLQYIGSESSFGGSAVPISPSSLTATTNERGGIVLNWSHAANYNRANWSVEIWRNNQSSFTGGSGAQQIATVKSDTYTDSITTQDFVSRYYWVRYAVDTRSIGSSGTQIKTVFSLFQPTKASSGVLGQASGAVDGISIVLSNDNATIPTNSDNSLDFSNTSASLEVFLGSTQLNYDSSSPFATPSFRVTNVNAFNVTAGAATTTSNTHSLANITGMSGNAGRIEFTVVVKDTTGTESTFIKTQRFFRSLRGTDAVNSRTSTIFRKNNSTISSTAGTFADPLNGNSSWSFSVPAISTDGDEVYSSTRTFTSDGTSPQDSSWSTPLVAFKRVDGETVQGPAGQSARQVNLYQKSSSTPSYSTTAGSYSNPRTGNTAWNFSVPSISANGDKVWVITRTFTSDGNSPQDSSWSAPVIYAQRTDGQAGPDGLRSIQGYLYYEKTSSGAPGAPGGNTYTFSTGIVTGSGINDGGTTNCWKNTPRPQDPSSTNTHWTVRYFGIEASASSSTIAVAYSSVVQHTNFTGVVTFSGGTFSQGGSNLNASNVSGFGDSNFSGNANDLNVSNASNFRNAIGAGTGNSNFSGAANDLNSFNQTFLQNAINNNSTFRSAVGAGTGNSNFSGSFNDLNNLSGVATAINNNTTTIDGAKITTGSIAASRIATNTITATSGIIANAAISNAMIDVISATKITSDTLSAQRINIDGITLSRSGDNLIIKTGGVNTNQIGQGAISASGAQSLSGSAASATKLPVVVATTTIDSAGGDLFIFGSFVADPTNGRFYRVTISIRQNCSSQTSATSGTLVSSSEMSVEEGDQQMDIRASVTSAVTGTNRINLIGDQTGGAFNSPSLDYVERSILVLELKR